MREKVALPFFALHVPSHNHSRTIAFYALTETRLKLLPSEPSADWAMVGWLKKSKRLAAWVGVSLYPKNCVEKTRSDILTFVSFSSCISSLHQHLPNTMTSISTNKRLEQIKDHIIGWSHSHHVPWYLSFILLKNTHKVCLFNFLSQEAAHARNTLSAIDIRTMS